MKKLIISIVCILGIAAMSFAQGGDKKDNREDSRKKWEASKIAYITSYLDLTSEESAEFWPIYSEYKKALKDLYGPKGERKKTSELTDAEATAKLNKSISMETKKAELKASYLGKFRTVLSDKKVLMLQRAESEFKKQVVKQYAERRGGGDKGQRSGGDKQK